MPKTLNESRFYMWRAVVAMIHADDVVTPHELSFIQDTMKGLELSAGQHDIIRQDIETPQLIHEMFGKIADIDDRKEFFALARALSWCDGDFDAQEEKILEYLEQSHNMAEYHNIMDESRDIVNEIELCENQWHFKTEKSKNLFGFLNKLRSAP